MADSQQPRNLSRPSSFWDCPVCGLRMKAWKKESHQGSELCLSTAAVNRMVGLGMHPCLTFYQEIVLDSGIPVVYDYVKSTTSLSKAAMGYWIPYEVHEVLCETSKSKRKRPFSHEDRIALIRLLGDPSRRGEFDAAVRLAGFHVAIEYVFDHDIIDPYYREFVKERLRCQELNSFNISGRTGERAK